jgi:4-carboxymuconolactone decarboxylase
LPDDISVKDLLELGMKTRREVLGDSYVDSAVAAIDDIDRDFQELLTASAWGLVWGRDTLSRRDRSLITITLLSSLGHYEELALHLKATANTGLTPADIREALLHLAIYGGVPAARKAFMVAKQVLAETNKSEAPDT